MMRLKCIWLSMETTLVSQGGFEDLVVIQFATHTEYLAGCFTKVISADSIHSKVQNLEGKKIHVNAPSHPPRQQDATRKILKTS